MAAEQGAETVSSALLARVAENEFGLSAADFDLTPEPAADATVPAEPAQPTVAEEPLKEVQSDEADKLAEAVAAGKPIDTPEPASEPEVSEEPVIVFADVAHDEDLPELIQDTLPELQVLNPDLMADESTAESAAESPIPELEPEPAAESTIPELEPEPAAESKIPELELEPAVQSSIPELAPESETLQAWDRDPTLAELKPDIAALEEAMALTQSPEPEKAAIETSQATESHTESAVSIPEITLDHAISQRIESQLIDEPGAVSPARPEPESAPEAKQEIPAAAASPDTAEDKPAKADGEMEKIAAELSRAKSLEDVDDRMAETLFGEELSLAASQFIAPPAAAESAQADVDAVLQTDQVIAEPAVAKQQVSAANGTSTDIEVTLQASQNGDEHGGMDLSASQRLKTVRALNADLHPSLRDPETPAANDSPPTSEGAPESIEDQINVSMTQTMKALKMPSSASDDEEQVMKGKSGFFSRFKRS